MSHRVKSVTPTPSPSPDEQRLGRRFYVVFDNETWMELGGPWVGEGESAFPARVWFMAVDPADDEDFDNQAATGQGTVLAEVWIDGEDLVFVSSAAKTLPGSRRSATLADQ